MKIKEINKNEIPDRTRGKRRNIITDIVKGFVESDAEAVELIGWDEHYKTYHSLYTVFKKHIPDGIKIVYRSNRAFLVKEDK